MSWYKPWTWSAPKKKHPFTKMPDEVVEHILAGKKVNAIKAYRSSTGLGLKEAKGEVDKLCRIMEKLGLYTAMPAANDW